MLCFLNIGCISSLSVLPSICHLVIEIKNEISSIKNEHDYVNYEICCFVCVGE